MQIPCLSVFDSVSRSLPAPTVSLSPAPSGAAGAVLFLRPAPRGVSLLLDTPGGPSRTPFRPPHHNPPPLLPPTSLALSQSRRPTTTAPGQPIGTLPQLRSQAPRGHPAPRGGAKSSFWGPQLIGQARNSTPIRTQTRFMTKNTSTTTQRTRRKASPQKNDFPPKEGT